MSKYDKLLFQILRGTADANLNFEDLCGLLEKIGFEKRIRGSHHMFRREGVVEKINLQRDGNKAKDLSGPAGAGGPFEIQTGRRSVKHKYEIIIY